MGLKIVTAPTVEPVSVAEAKLHLKVDISDDDALIGALITAAREECEHLTDRAIAEQTLALLLDSFPAAGIKLPRPPVSSITAVEYVDSDGATQTLAGAAYYLDDAQEPSWVLPAYDTSWPSTRGDANAVVVTYEAGYATCPEALRAWILLRVGTLYVTRMADSDKPAMPSPFVDRIIDRYRVMGV